MCLARASAVSVIAVLLASRSVARADDDVGFSIGSRPAWLLLGGVTSGVTVALADRGGLVGGALSLARLRDGTFTGCFADGYYDGGVHGTYVIGGLEVGHKLVGLDGGIALRFADGEQQVGAATRLTVGVGVLGVYARYAHFWTVMHDDDVIQVGLEWKLPLWVGGR